MQSVPYKKPCYDSKQLLIDHNIIDFKFYADSQLRTKYIPDENEKKLLDFISDKEKFKIKSFNDNKILDFLNLKFKAMEKLNLDDECSEGEIETRKININKNVFPKPKHSNIKKGSKSPKKTIKFKNSFSSKKSENSKSQKKTNKFKNPHSSKKPGKKNNNINIIINNEGKIAKSDMESIDLVDVINFDINKEIKEKESNKFFSNKFILSSIISEMKDV